jgi:hypothetical protein
MPRPFAPDVFGFPRGATAIASMLADNEATNYVRQVVTNDGTPTFAVLLADEATQDDATAMQERYRARVVDRGKRGTPAFFGAVRDIKPLGFTLSDLEFPDLRRVSREDICAAFGVDPRMVGIASASKDGGLSGVQYAEARQRLVQHTIEPMLSAISDELNHWLAPEFGDVWIEFDADVLRDLVENDAETSKRVQEEFKASLRTWEESRRALKLPPVPEPGDTLAQVTGLTLIPAAVAVVQPSAAPATPLTTEEATGTPIPDVKALPSLTGDSAAASTTPKPVRSDRVAMMRTFAEDALSGDQIEQLAELLESVIEKELPAGAVKAIIAAAFPKLDKALIADMLAALEGFVPAPESEDGGEDGGGDGQDSGNPEPGMYSAKDGVARSDMTDPRYAYWSRAMGELDRVERQFYDVAKKTFAAQAADVARMFTKAERSDAVLKKIDQLIADANAEDGEYYRQWRAAYLDLIGQVYLGGARQVAGVGMSFNLQSPEVQAAIQARADRLAGYIGQETARQVTAVIHAGEVGGLSMKETADLIQASVFGETMTDTRAMRIAKTESAGAMSQGGWDQANDMGIYQAKEWLAFEDDKTRMTHLFCMEQGPIPMDEEFTNGLQYPLDPAGPAGEVINCRCVLMYYDQPASEVQRI